MLAFILQVQLSEDDIKTILDTLLYDGKVERILNASGEYLYLAMESYLPPPGIVRMPCGICPVSDTFETRNEQHNLTDCILLQVFYKNYNF